MITPLDRSLLDLAHEQARTGLAEGGIPIGSVLAAGETVLGRGYNRRFQQGDPVLHAEMDALRDAGRLSAAQYARCTLYTTLSPCDMCSGAALLYGIPRIVVGEDRTFQGPHEYLLSRGVLIEVADVPEIREMLESFVKDHPELWNEDIGENV